MKISGNKKDSPQKNGKQKILPLRGFKILQRSSHKLQQACAM
jgi:hypothetical protein